MVDGDGLEVHFLLSAYCNEDHISHEAAPWSTLEKVGPKVV